MTNQPDQTQGQQDQAQPADTRPSFGWLIAPVMVLLFVGGYFLGTVVEEQVLSAWAAGVAALSLVVGAGTSNLFKTRARPFSAWWSIVFTAWVPVLLLGVSVGGLWDAFAG